MMANERTGVSSLALQGLEKTAATTMMKMERHQEGLGTRLSFELHCNAFEHMWIQGGELNLLDLDGGCGQPQQQPHRGSDSKKKDKIT